MLVNLLSNRWIQGGLAFFLLCVFGSWLYSWHVQRTTQDELAQSDVLLQQRANQNQTRTAVDTVEISPVDFEQAETPLETHGAQVIADDTATLPSDDAISVDLSDAFLPNDFVSETELSEDVRVSPFGFGPYPEVPADYPAGLPPAWTWSEDKRQSYDSATLKDFELMARVLIKLWKQGDRDFRGVIRDDTNGKVYPLYPDRAYVTWRDLKDENGKVIFRYAGNLTAANGFPRVTFRDFMEGTIPTGIRFIERETAGIDPYQFLNLQRR